MVSSLSACGVCAFVFPVCLVWSFDLPPRPGMSFSRPGIRFEVLHGMKPSKVCCLRLLTCLAWWRRSIIYAVDNTEM
jgi:hypothetical protein